MEVAMVPIHETNLESQSFEFHKSPHVFKNPKPNLKMDSACAVTNFVVDFELLKTETLPRKHERLRLLDAMSFL